MAYPVYYVPSGDVLPVLFDTYDGGTGASITLTGLAVTDIEIYKDGGVTQRASDAGYTLLDTDGIDFDGITGIHGFSIDTGDNTDAGFYAVGAWYHVVVASVTVDGQTVNFIACAFRIMAAEGVAGVPDVNTTHISDTAQTAGDLKASLNTIDDFVDTEVAAILADTNELQTDWADGGRLDLILDARASQASVDTIDNFLDTEIAAILEDTGTTLQGELDGIQADTEDIQARLPAALTAGGNMKSDALAISGDTAAADALEALMDGTIVAAVNDAAATTTSFIADGFTEATNDHFKGRLITFIGGALNGQQTAITGYAGATQTFTVVALTEAPADNQAFVIH